MRSQLGSVTPNASATQLEKATQREQVSRRSLSRYPMPGTHASETVDRLATELRLGPHLLHRMHDLHDVVSRQFTEELGDQFVLPGV